MKIIYDARWIRTDGVLDGVSRYSLELGKAIYSQNTLNVTWLVCHDKQKQMLPGANFIIENDPNNITREISLPKRLNQYMPDVVYSPFFIMGCRGRNYKLVLTIHDMIYFHYKTPPHWLP